ncbi:MAG TPA: bifunctional YncE family protein/alkaline phosphatase family protein [Gemmataceae bacterium]|jgi:YVTN family beta-propeller protein
MATRWLPPLVLFTAAMTAAAQDAGRVGPADGGHLVPTGQLVRPAGRSVAWAGRPVDLALSPDGKTLYAKDDTGLVVIDPAAGAVRQHLPFGKAHGGGSMHGLAVSRDGARVYATTAEQSLAEAGVGPDGRLTLRRMIPLPGPKGGDDPSHPCGIALSADGRTAYVCLSRDNALAVVDLTAAAVVARVPVGVAPYAVVLSSDGSAAYVSNWGGRRPKAGERTAPSSGTPVLVDERGVAASGTVGRVDLRRRVMDAEAAVGLHPTGLALSRDGGTLYVANANSDTVSILATPALTVEHTLTVRPDPALPFGSATNAVALSPDGTTLYAANGGNNAVAVIRLGRTAKDATVAGFIPAGWYPGAVAATAEHVYVANVKGEGSRTPQAGKPGWAVTGYRGTVTRVGVPAADTLAAYSAQVRADARVPQVLRALEKAQPGVKPVPVPARAGEPSLFDHVVYVIKENRTYDQVFGDVKAGNGDPKLCVFGEDVTPNHHALAREFVLLDNFYCNGVVSADGHSWATEGNVTDHLEKSFGGFTRSYTFGDDPLTYSATGFLWDNALLRGLSFRNYGEMAYSEPAGKVSFPAVYKDFTTGANRIRIAQKYNLPTLERYSSPDYPGWSLDVPDVLRADRFLKELRECERTGTLPNLVIVYLPQDHTSGTKAGMPTPRAHVADNDLALGRVVEAITKSKFWPTTCVFVIEDDPQDGFDHVDGHRSLCLVASPYTKRRAVVSKFYNQTAVLHTMERMLGLPPMNQLDAAAPVMAECFTAMADVTPFTARPAAVPLDELNPPAARLRGRARQLAEESLKLDFSRPDAAEDDDLNRILWHAVKGDDAPYPADLAGPHGRGLKALGLKHAPRGGVAPAR